MIDAPAVDAVVDQYSRHGWTLRRILVTEVPPETFSSKFPNIEIQPSDIDAIWFSRINRNSETWELRRLTGAPFALVRSIDRGLFSQDRDELLHDVELKMSKTLQRSDGENPSEK